MKIGVTFSHDRYPAERKKIASLRRYMDALADAGAEGVALWRPRVHDEQKIAARAAKLAARLDGVIVSGGADLHPEMFGQAVNPDAKVKLIHPLRPAFESHLIRAMRERGKPLLGICYGCQYFNVLNGGTIWQDIHLHHPQAIVHHESRHKVRLEPGSTLHCLIGEDEFEVSSYHHQAIAQCAPNMRITAWASDGIIEAIELDDDPLWLGVQWHPEWDRESSATKKLFAAFVSACRSRVSGSGFRVEGLSNA